MISVFATYICVLEHSTFFLNAFFDLRYANEVSFVLNLTIIFTMYSSIVVV